MKPRPIPSDEEREDLRALRERGILVTPRIREVLWMALDVFDVSRDQWAARIIRATPRDGDPVSEVRQALIRRLHEINTLARQEERVLAARLRDERDAIRTRRWRE